MTAAAFVDGVLLAAIIATWMWTWWWNRYVVQQQPLPDYEAAEVRLTTELILMFGSDTHQVPRKEYRQVIAFNVVNAAFDELYREGKQ